MCKKLPQRNSKYLEFVRSRLCSFCLGGPADAHHPLKFLLGISTGGRGKKGSDYLSIAVCRPCHGKLHNGALKPERTHIFELIICHLIGFIGDLLSQPRRLQDGDSE